MSVNFQASEVRNSGREVTPNLPDRIGLGADAAASAARLRAAAEAATLRAGYAPAALSSDRNERQTLHQPARASRARVVVEVELLDENRARAPARTRRGPSPLFLTQYFAQETAHAGGDAVISSKAASGYPSLGFDQDILLPGDTRAFAADTPRLDILV